MPPPGKGFRQQLGVDDGSPAPGRSELGRYFANLYGEGLLPARHIAEGASASSRDHHGDVAEDVARLASARPTKLRKRGDVCRPDSRHASRGVQRALAHHSRLPETFRFDCPLWDRVAGVPVTEKVAILLPHQLLDTQIPPGMEYEYCDCSDFQQGLAGELEEWKQSVGFQPDGRPVAALALWGDAAPYSQRDSLYMLVLTILSGEHRKYFWLCGISKRKLCDCGCRGRHTLDCLWQALIWSLNCLIVGRHPTVDHTGAPFPDGSACAKVGGHPLRIRAAMLRFMGDWEWFKASLGLKGWRGEGPDRHLCWLCAGSLKGRCPCYDFSSSAAWRRNKQP